MHDLESPWALTEHAFRGVGHFFTHTHLGRELLGLGLLAGIVYVGWQGLKAIGNRISGTRVRLQGVLGGSA